MKSSVQLLSQLKLIERLTKQPNKKKLLVQHMIVHITDFENKLK